MRLGGKIIHNTKNINNRKIGILSLNSQMNKKVRLDLQTQIDDVLFVPLYDQMQSNLIYRIRTTNSLVGL